MIKHSMKKLFLLCMVSLGLYGTLFPQAPTESPIASPTADGSDSRNSGNLNSGVSINANGSPWCDVEFRFIRSR